TEPALHSQSKYHPAPRSHCPAEWGSAPLALLAAGLDPGRTALPQGDVPAVDSHPVAPGLGIHVPQPVMHPVQAVGEVDEGVRLLLGDQLLVLHPERECLLAVRDLVKLVEQRIQLWIAMADPLEGPITSVAVEEVGVVDPELRPPPDQHGVEVSLAGVVDSIEEGAPLEDLDLHVDTDPAQVCLDDVGDVGADLVPAVRAEREAE